MGRGGERVSLCGLHACVRPSWERSVTWEWWMIAACRTKDTISKDKLAEQLFKGQKKKQEDTRRPSENDDTKKMGESECANVCLSKRLLSFKDSKNTRAVEQSGGVKEERDVPTAPLGKNLSTDRTGRGSSSVFVLAKQKGPWHASTTELLCAKGSEGLHVVCCLSACPSRCSGIVSGVALHNPLARARQKHSEQ